LVMKNFTGANLVNEAVVVDEPKQFAHDDKQGGQWQWANRVWWGFARRENRQDRLPALPGSEEYIRDVERRALWLG
jgi:hypothetical protein